MNCTERRPRGWPARVAILLGGLLALAMLTPSGGRADGVPPIDGEGPDLPNRPDTDVSKVTLKLAGASVYDGLKSGPLKLKLKDIEHISILNVRLRASGEIRLELTVGQTWPETVEILCTFTPRAKPAGGYPGFTIAVHEVGGSQRSWALPSEDARFQPEVGGPGKKHEYRMTFLDVDKDDTIPFKQCEVFKP